MSEQVEAKLDEILARLKRLEYKIDKAECEAECAEVWHKARHEEMMSLVARVTCDAELSHMLRRGGDAFARSVWTTALGGKP